MLRHWPTIARSYKVRERRRNAKLSKFGLPTFEQMHATPEVNKMPELPDQRVDANVIKSHGPNCTVIGAGGHDSGTDEHGEPYTKPFVCVEFPDKYECRYYPNKTSQKLLAGFFGTNTDNWVGKAITFTTQRQNVSGTMRDVVYAEVG